MLVGRVLRRQEAESRRVVLPQERLERSEVVVFAAETQDQSSARVRMSREPRQDLLSVFEVVSQLRAAERVGEREHRLDVRVRLEPLLESGSERLRRSGHATHRGNDPELVAGAGSSVRAQVALPSAPHAGSVAFEGRVIRDARFGCQRRFQVVRVHVLSAQDRRACPPDGPAVLHDRRPLGVDLARHFVTRRDWLQHLERLAGNLEHFAGREAAQRDGHRVLVVNQERRARRAAAASVERTRERRCCQGSLTEGGCRSGRRGSACRPDPSRARSARRRRRCLGTARRSRRRRTPRCCRTSPCPRSSG